MGRKFRSFNSVGRLRRNVRHRDPRLVVGLVLIAFSAILGARVLASAGARSPVWVAAHDLASGTVLGAADLVSVRVHLGTAGSRYLGTAGPPPLGRRLRVSVVSGELLPATAVAASADRRLVTVPVEPLHLPANLGHGALVDVYVTPRDSGVGAPASRLVQAEVLVAALGTADSSGEVAVILDVAPAQAGALIAAVRGGAIDLVGRAT